jgi:hypothetical protein
MGVFSELIYIQISKEVNKTQKRKPAPIGAGRLLLKSRVSPEEKRHQHSEVPGETGNPAILQPHGSVLIFPKDHGSEKSQEGSSRESGKPVEILDRQRQNHCSEEGQKKSLPVHGYRYDSIHCRHSRLTEGEETD